MVGLIADGVEAELKAGGGAGGGQGVQLFLAVAGDTGVVWVVGVGFGEGGGAGAEGAIHEALEHGEVEERVVGGVGGAARLEVAEGEVEVDPFGEAEVEFAFAFHGFEHEPVIPRGEVLNAGDAVGECVGDGEIESLAAGVGVGRRDFAVDEGDGRSFADDAGGGAVRREIDLAAGGGGAVSGDCSGIEGGAVGDDDVTVRAVEDGGVAGRDLINIFAGR